MRHLPCAALFILAAAGFSELHAREYDPRTGRFLQTDPLTERRPQFHYLYASNNPLMFVDPFGLRDMTAAEKMLFTSVDARVRVRIALEDAYKDHRKGGDLAIGKAIEGIKAQIAAVKENEEL